LPTTGHPASAVRKDDDLGPVDGAALNAILVC
jgi:hypothetical protein